MAITFQTSDGRVGTLDVAKLVAEEMHGQITGVKDGMVFFKTEDGTIASFGLGQWAQEHQANIVQMEGFNGPDTALESPPNGMNYMDQTTFFHDGMDMNALSAMFPKNMQRDDGRVVVLDSDGLWKTMWSPFIHAPMPAMDENELAQGNLIQDPKMVIRTAGITFLFGLAGMDPTTDHEHNFKCRELAACLEIIGRNAPFEVKSQIAKLVEQTTGVTQFKFLNALLAPQEVCAALDHAKRDALSSFQYRMMQLDMAETIMKATQLNVREKFMSTVVPLAKLPETTSLILNLKQISQEFIQFMVGLDLLRDISKTTGLNEWIALNEDQAYDPSRLPDMPEFVPVFVQLLKYLMPIVQKPQLAMVKGRAALKAATNLIMMVDDCIFHLAGVPDHSAKYKMVMALKKLIAQIETKLAFAYHPDPNTNRDGLKENPFMQAKSQYLPERESIYRLIQNPKESWTKVIMDALMQNDNIERYYDTLPDNLQKLYKSFAALDAAYDMQPWVDVEHQRRTHDAFSEFHPSFGGRPPEAGYLSKNSQRAVHNISESLIIGASVLQSMNPKESKQLIRNPFHFALLLKSLMVAAVNRELGTVEVLNKFGIGPMQDDSALPDPNRMWEDPERVQVDIDRQIEELMGSLAMEQMAQQPSGPGPGQGPTTDDELEEQPKAGAGPMGPPQRAVPVRR